MDNKSFSNQMALAIMLVSIILSACLGSTRRARQIADSIRNRKIDSTVAADISTQTNQAVALIDSLETAKVVSPQRIYYYRAWLYHKQGDRKKAEQCLVKAMDGDALLKENRELFYRAADLLSSFMINRNEFRKALAVATLEFEAAKVDQTSIGRRWVALSLNGMGYCEMRLGHVDDAERNFSQAYITLKQLADADGSYENLVDFARVSRNIVDAYISTERYNKAAAWIESAKEAMELLVASPECLKEMRARYLGGLAMQRAVVLLHTANRSDADASYEEAVRLHFDQTDLGVLECATYLKETERWDELQELLPRVDSIYTAWGDVDAAQRWRMFDRKANPAM